MVFLGEELFDVYFGKRFHQEIFGFSVILSRSHDARQILKSVFSGVWYLEILDKTHEFKFSKHTICVKTEQLQELRVGIRLKSGRNLI